MAESRRQHRRLRRTPVLLHHRLHPRHPRRIRVLWRRLPHPWPLRPTRASPLRLRRHHLRRPHRRRYRPHRSPNSRGSWRSSRRSEHQIQATRRLSTIWTCAPVVERSIQPALVAFEVASELSDQGTRPDSSWSYSDSRRSRAEACRFQTPRPTTAAPNASAPGIHEILMTTVVVSVEQHVLVGSGHETLMF